MTGDEHENIEGVEQVPDVRKPEPASYRPSAEVLIGFAMLGMFAIINAAAAWPETIGEYAGLIAFVYFVVLTAWARKR